MTPAVIDASVAVKWFIEEPGGDYADEVLEQIYARTREFLVPELFFYEVLAVCMRQHPAPGDFAQTDMPFLLSLPLTRAQMTASLATAATTFALAGLSGYDASYAALAKHVGGEWLTFDRKAAARLGNPSFVRVLGV
jgi:predicted nucleic acid-binding protein